MFVRTCNVVSHDNGWSVCARHLIHVSCAWVIVCSLFDPRFALFICHSHLPLHPPELWILPCPLPCGCPRSKIPCALRPMRSLALWANNAPLTGYEPNFFDDYHYSETTDIYLHEQSSDTRPSYLHDAEISDDTIGRALSSPLFTQEREEPAGRRQAYHSLEESLLPSQSLSVCHVRTGRPVHELSSLGSSIRENPSRESEKWANQDSPWTRKRANSRWL